MKGIFIVKPLEYNLSADGEKWRQGEKIKGQIIIKNHGSEKIELNHLNILLNVGMQKKVKVKNLGAFEKVLANNLGEKISLGASEVKEFPFEFLLPEDGPINDKDKSVYLLLSDNQDAWPLGMLELGVIPKKIIEDFLEIFKNFLRFKIGPIKYSKGMVEVKLTPPNSRELGHVESLVLRMIEVNKIVVMEYIFTLLSFDMASGNMLALKKTIQVDRSLTAKQYTIYGDSLNQEFLIAEFSGVIKEATPKFMTPK